jgi:stage V sporulation protein B
MYTLLVGVALKILINYNLIGTAKVNIYGAPIGSLVCYSVSMLPNLYYAHKYTRLPYDPLNIFFKPLAATACMGAVIFLMEKALPAGRIATVGLILIGIAAYGAFARLFGALRKEDLKPFTAKLHGGKKHNGTPV